MIERIYFTLIILLLITLQLYGQTNEGTKYKIPKGQFLYTIESKGNENLKPYKKRYNQIYNGSKTEIIEIGDYVVEEKYINNILMYDTLNYLITTLKIVKKDTIQTERILELRKKSRYDIEAKLKFTSDKVYVYQIVANKEKWKFPKTKEYVHPSDQALYVKIGEGDSFKYDKIGLSLQLASAPIKMRLNSKLDSLSAGEFKMNNVGFILGLGTRHYEYKKGRLRKRGVWFGPYIGFSNIKLSNENTLEILEEEINRLGFEYGLGLTREIDNFNLGALIAIEKIAKSDNYQWIFNKKVFFGITIGYTLN